jgi:ATP-dependent Clp protease ATP-binding subunit ClpC
MTSHIKKTLKGLIALLNLEDLFPHRVRRLVFHMFGAASLILLIVTVFGSDTSDNNIRGGALLCLAITIFLFMLEAYYYSISGHAKERCFVSFDIGELLYYADDDDLTCALLFSDIGDAGMKRLGYTEEDIREFLIERSSISFGSVFEEVVQHITAENYFKIIYEHDSELRDFLLKRGIGEAEFVGAMTWMLYRERRVIEKERFWSKETLLRIPGIGKNWSYGETYTLDRYGTDLTEIAGEYDASYEKSKEKVITRLESVLVRGRGSNAIVISDDEASRLDVVTILARMVNEGKAILSLQHKRIFLINPNLIIENGGEKIACEREFASVLGEADRAGNVILVIPQFSAFIKSAGTIGADVLSVIAPFVHSPHVHIVGLDSKKDYYDFLGNKSTITENFELLTTDGGDDESLILMLIEEVEKIEAESRKILVSYGAVLAIVDSAKKYFEESLKAIKSKELLVESIGLVASQGRKIVFKSDVLALVETETGIPTTAPTGEEKAILLHLKELLKERIIGQDEACEVVAEALKRSRAGVRNPNKPLGTFLFLGPTGVGKTETVKVLANIMFQNEARISRFDMSEYRDYSASDRLLGSFSGNELGTLPLALREKQYGVLLLDEFEKTTPEIMNLFLRIFDEGIFTDAHNNKVSARNNVIIATSNAGSEIIWDIIRSGKNLEDEKARVVDTIIASGIFKPELLNRFDAVVLFHPLSARDLEKIAKLMMDKFATRMAERGIIVKASSSFLNYLVQKGNDPKFGARPMNRAIEDEVERFVADKILRGEIKEGDKLIFELNEEGLFHFK